MNLEDFLSAARDYARLAPAVRAEVDALFDGQALDATMASALPVILAFLNDNGFGDDSMAEEIRNYLKGA